MPNEDNSITFKVEGTEQAHPRDVLVKFLQETIVNKQFPIEASLKAAEILAGVLTS